MPCVRFIEYMIQVGDLIQLTQKGIHFLRGYPIAIEALMPGGGDSEKEKEERRLGEAKRLARLAQSEIESDFPLLQGHAIMGAWGALEAMVEDLAISWIQHNPSVLDKPTIGKIRIPMAEFMGMSEQDRLRFIVTGLQREMGLEFKGGATKFEGLLRAIDLGGPVDKKVKDVIFDTQNIRNVFAHRGGIADSRFVLNCPHLQYSVGDAVKISGDRCHQVMGGLVTYGFIVLNRCRSIEGLSLITKDVPGFEGALSIPNNAEA